MMERMCLIITTFCMCVHKILACNIREYGHREEINGKKYNDKGKTSLLN